MYTIEELENWINRISEAYEDNPSDKKVNSEIREIRYQINRMLETWPSLIANCRQYIEECNKDINSKKLSKTQEAEAKEAIEGNNNSIARYEFEIKKLNILLDTIDKYFSNEKPFDKYKCIQNIKELMSKKDVKIGQIESDAKVRPGYMSRLNKPDNDTMPSITFLISASRLLDVTIEELLFGVQDELSADEEIINDFLCDLISDTNRHEIHWNKEEEKSYRPYLTSRRFPLSNPLLVIREFDNPDLNPYLVTYGSKFYKESNVFVKTCYTTVLPGSSNKVFLVWCYTDKDDKYIPDSEFIEVYLTDDKEKANPVCNALRVSPSICKSLNDLYKLAMKDALNVYLNDETRNVINSYRTRRTISSEKTERSQDDKK